MLEQAGVDEADAAVVSTDGDNTNLVIGQVLQKRYGIKTVVVRVLDPRARSSTPIAGSTPSARRRPRSRVLLETVRASAPQPAEAS